MQLMVECQTAVCGKHKDKELIYRETEAREQEDKIFNLYPKP